MRGTIPRMTGANAARFVDTPTFILNSKYDYWQQIDVLNVSCVPPGCPPAVESFWVAYGAALVRALEDV
eukprot:gene9562-3500_t